MGMKQAGQRFEGFDYDVIVVGSGAGGGMAAYELTRRGIRVLLLEAGRHYDPVTETPMFQTAAEAPLRGVSTPDKQFGFYDATVDGGWQVPGEPYTTADGSEFLWWRARMLGGRTNHWGRYALRFSPHDFQAYSRDGHGADWPLVYEDLAQWYDKAETLIGVCGDNPGLDDIPDSAPGVLHPPPQGRVYERLVQAACKKLGIPVAYMRRAVMTRPMQDPEDPRQPCYWATPCGRGCSIGAAFQTPTSVLPMAERTGRLHTVTQCLVTRVHVDSQGRVEALSYVNRQTGVIGRLQAKVIVLSASACETARILLNSRTEALPRGVANASGQVGRNLMDSTGANITANVPGLYGRPRYNEDGHTGNHLFVPWWGHQAQVRGELNFARGYHFEISGGFAPPGISLGAYARGHGEGLKRSVQHRYGAYLRLALRGEMLPNAESYMDLDPHAKDQWGNPVPRFHWRWSEQELNQVAHGLRTAHQIFALLGGEVLEPQRTPEEAILKGGQIIHEVGTARMGTDPRYSVTDADGRCWDHPGLYVMDGAVFASNPHKNCTLTIMTLALRNASRLADSLKRRQV